MFRSNRLRKGTYIFIIVGVHIRIPLQEGGNRSVPSISSIIQKREGGILKFVVTTMFVFIIGVGNTCDVGVATTLRVY
jgi:hypothetical protein